MEYVNISLVVLFFLAWNESDFIDFQPKYCFFPNWRWYVENRWETKSWWLKNVFTVFLDGSHFARTLYRIIGYFFFSQLLFQGWLVYATTIALYIVTGAIHSLMNKTL